MVLSITVQNLLKIVYFFHELYLHLGGGGKHQVDRKALKALIAFAARYCFCEIANLAETGF